MEGLCLLLMTFQEVGTTAFLNCLITETSPVVQFGSPLWPILLASRDTTYSFVLISSGWVCKLFRKDIILMGNFVKDMG